MERNSVKKVKLATKPMIIPKGLDFPKDEERIIGKTGKMQGERMVTTPAKKAKTISKITYLVYFIGGDKISTSI